VHVATENDFRLLFSFGTGKFRQSGYYQRPEEVRISVIPVSEQRPRGPCMCRCSATRFASVHWGGRLLRCGAGVRWRWAKLDMAWEFGSPVHVGAVLRRQPAFLHSCYASDYPC
jgi:hypothetical protein